MRLQEALGWRSVGAVGGVAASAGAITSSSTSSSTNTSATYAANEVRTEGVRAVVGLRAEQCDYWREHGFGPEFWWSD